MAFLELSESTIRRLQEIADQQLRPVEEVINDLLDSYPQAEELGSVETEANPQPDPLESIVGLFADSELTDMSTTVRETMAQHYRRKYGSTD